MSHGELLLWRVSKVNEAWRLQELQYLVIKNTNKGIKKENLSIIAKNIK